MSMQWCNFLIKYVFMEDENDEVTHRSIRIKNVFLIFQSKQMLWALKIEHPQHNYIETDGLKKYSQFCANIFGLT